MYVCTSVNRRLLEISFLPNVLRNVVTKCKYPPLFKLFKLSLTIPVASAKSERSISALRRVYNYTLTTIGIDRVSVMSLLAI